MDIRSTLDAPCDAFNAHDLDRIMSFFAEDCVLEMPRGNQPWGTRYEGKRRHRAFRLCGRQCRQVEMDLTGTTRQGTRLKVWDCDFWTFRDGKVIRKDSYWKIVE